MKFSTLLTTAVTAASTVSAGCYKDGAQLGSLARQDRAREVISHYCLYAHGVYKPDGVWKYCFNMGYGSSTDRDYLLLEFDRTGGGSQDLSKEACRAYLGEIVSECKCGGRKNSVDNWSYRLDPGTTCDGKTPTLGPMEGVRIRGGPQP